MRREPNWINAENPVRGRAAAHVIGRKIIQPITTVPNARLGGVHSGIDLIPVGSKGKSKQYDHM